MTEMNNVNADHLDVIIAECANPETSIDRIGEVLLKIEFEKKRWKELSDALDAAMFDHIKATGEPIVIGETLYKIGNAKQVKCRSNAEAVRTLLELGGPEAIEETLGSNAWKYGAVEKLPCMDNETFARLFEVSYPEKLVEGKPAKKPLKINTAFLK